MAWCWTCLSAEYRPYAVLKNKTGGKTAEKIYQKLPYNICLFWIMAERVGFEPTVRFDTYTCFPSKRLRPLGHLSS